MNPVFSVIIPIYNVEAYLRDCLDCLTSQSFKSFEVLLINDGSSDNSEVICNEYTEKDARFSLTTTRNQGQGAARNIGLSLAEGQYIYFYDSDDKLATNTLEKLNEIHQKHAVDIVMFDGDVFGESSSNNFTYTRAANHGEVELSKYIDLSLLEQTFTPSPCLYSFRKDAVADLRFIEGIIYEDLAFYVNLTLDNKLSFYVLNEVLFHRRVRLNSTMTTAIQEKNALAAIKVFEHISEGKMSKTKLLFLQLYYNNVVSFVALAFKGVTPFKYRMVLAKYFLFLTRHGKFSVKGLLATIIPELKKVTKKSHKKT